MRRWVLVGLSLALLLPMGVRAQAPMQTWTCGLDDVADAAVRCIAAPAETGLRRYITDMVVQSTTTAGGTILLQYNTATALGGATDCGTDGVTIFPPDLFPTGQGRFIAAPNTAKATMITMRQPLVVPGGKDLCVFGDPTNTITIQLSGYVAP